MEATPTSVFDSWAKEENGAGKFIAQKILPKKGKN
jgi:hypothetical protein